MLPCTILDGVIDPEALAAYGLFVIGYYLRWNEWNTQNSLSLVGHISRVLTPATGSGSAVSLGRESVHTAVPHQSSPAPPSLSTSLVFDIPEFTTRPFTSAQDSDHDHRGECCLTQSQQSQSPSNFIATCPHFVHPPHVRPLSRIGDNKKSRCRE